MPSSPSLGREGLRLWPRWKPGCERKEGEGGHRKRKVEQRREEKRERWGDEMMRRERAGGKGAGAGREKCGGGRDGGRIKGRWKEKERAVEWD